MTSMFWLIPAFILLAHLVAYLLDVRAFKKEVTARELHFKIYHCKLISKPKK